jgi:hypothetical protein
MASYIRITGIKKPGTGFYCLIFLETLYCRNRVSRCLPYHQLGIWADKVRQKILFLGGLAMDKLNLNYHTKANNMPLIFYQRKQNIY